MSNTISQLILRAKQLLCFAEAVHYSSISRAAKENLIKQPNLSSQISDLEKTLQKKLIDRYSKGVGLTDDGEPYYKIATELKSLLLDVDNLAVSEDKICGNIKLWTSDGLASVYLADCLEKFSRKYPKVNFDINCSIDMPELHEFDMALLFYKPTIKSLKIAAERMLHFSLFASKDYIKHYGMPQNIKDLIQNHQICANLIYANRWKDWAAIIEKAKHATTINNSSGVLLNLVKAGKYVALMPKDVGQTENNLLEIKDIVPEFKTKFYLVLKNTNLKNKKIKDFADIICAETLK